MSKKLNLRLRDDAPIQGWTGPKGNTINVKPGERIPNWVLKRYRIPNKLIHPDSLRNQGAFEFAAKKKDQFSVGIERSMNGIGDLLMASVIAKALKYRYGNKVIVYYVVQNRPSYERILQYNPWIDKVFISRIQLDEAKVDIRYNVNDLEFVAELREFKKDERVGRNRASIYLQNMDLYLENRTPYYHVLEKEREWAKRELRKLGLK